MARPDCIKRLHEVKYDLRWCERQEKPAMWRRYQEALAEASRIRGVSMHALEAAGAHAVLRCSLPRRRAVYPDAPGRAATPGEGFARQRTPCCNAPLAAG